ncbi:MAG: T9SS type A sorting domain-containing protein [Cytophagaceae bacterium]|nr:MAG: T9SS type A sorting domain-containing protein [Cytophagaceae bacterium]
MAAGFWQANPTLTVQQVISFLKRSGSQALAPDNSLGYGIPNFVTAYNLAHPTAPLATLQAATLAQLQVYPNPSHDEDLLLNLPADLRGAALQVRFYDARGAVVAEQQLPASAAATVALRPGALRQGVYTCTVQSAKVAPRALRFVKL